MKALKATVIVLLTALTLAACKYDDWNAIKQNEWALQTLDLEGATYDTDDLQYVQYMYTDPVPLTTTKLPQGVTGLRMAAFVNCKNLTSIELPASLTKIGPTAFILLFQACLHHLPGGCAARDVDLCSLRCHQPL